MLDPFFGLVRKTTEATLQVQQELFTRWAAFWPGAPALSGVWGEPLKPVQPWAQAVSDVVKKQYEAQEAHVNAALKTLRDAVGLVEVKDPEELRTGSVRLWQNTIDFIRQACATQLRDFQVAFAKCAELAVKGAA
jgi:hypothetical protein